MISQALVIATVFAQPAELAATQGPQMMWADDILVWDMSENSTWAGPGLTYCTGFCDCQGKLYCGSIINSSTSGSVFRFYSSSDVGQTWEYESSLSGGSWYLTDPEMAASIEDPPAYLFSLYAATSESTQPKGIRFTLPDFQFDGFLNPNWPSGADTLLSVEAVCHPESGDLWVFGNDCAHNIYLTRSSDNGNSWSDAELVAEDAVLPSAAAGPQNYVYMAYRRVSDNRVMCLSFGETSYFETEVADGGDTTAPIVAAEKSGDEVVAVVFHDSSIEVRIALSYTGGAQWNVSDPLAAGYYPFIDVLNDSRRCALAYIAHPLDQIFYMSATSLEGLLYETPEMISGGPVFPGGPPVIRHGTLSSGVSLFFMGPGTGGEAPRDLWFDNSLNTQSIPKDLTEQAFLSAWPSPFTSSVTVRFSLMDASYCELLLYSIDGRLVETLWSGVTYGETLQLGSDLPSGVYSAILRSGELAVSRRIVKL